MRLFWKIYCVVFISFVAVIALSSYVTLAKRISDVEKSIAEEYRAIGAHITSDIERSQSESKWPFESLKKLSEDSDHIFWWIVKEDGIIHLADKASFIGSNSYDYFPQAAGISLDNDVLLNSRQKYGFFIKSFRVGKDRWSFWLGFSTKHIAEANRKIILSTVIYSTSTLVILGLVLYYLIIHFLRPIKSLASGAEKIGKGDLNHRVEVKSNDELGYLARSFNKMTEDLKRTTTSIDNLNREITERIKAEEQVRQQNGFLSTILESLTHPFYVINVDDYTIKIANSAAHREYGENLCGKATCHKLTHMRDKPCDTIEEPCPIAEIKRTGKPVVLEHIHYDKDRNHKYVEVHAYPIFDNEGKLSEVIEYSFDITDRKQAEVELKEAQEKLIETARKVGMAEVAADVLHNVGNVLNSINVSTTLVTEKVANSELANLEKLASLINDHIEDLGTFLTEHPQGKHIPVYLTEVSKCLTDEQADIVSRLRVLAENVEHVKEIIGMQQSYAKISGVEVRASLAKVVEDAIQINSAGLERHGTQLIRELDELPDVEIDKQKVLQILVNLINNAKYALSSSNKEDKLLTIRIYKHGEDRFRIEVADNGVGISEENLTKIFSHGFTTKQDGHGFGLHSSALASKEMGGSLTVHSDGVGQGATFTLELPFKPVEVMQ